MMKRLKTADKIVVGAKQVNKAIKGGNAQVVYLARDADQHIIAPLVEACEDQDVEICYVDEMSQLGKACGIKVNASAAAILK